MERASGREVTLRVVGLQPVQLLRRVNRRIRRKGFADTLGATWNIGLGLADYYLNPFAVKTRGLPPRDWQRIRLEMERAGLRVEPYRINVSAFHGWLGRAGFPSYYAEQYGPVFTEKALEHYVGADLLQLSAGQLLVDVAAAQSPWYGMAPRLYEVKTLALDLVMPVKQVYGHRIVADATRIPVPDRSVDAMALHCAYETFEGDADTRLIPEAARVLCSGGRLVILPLYMHHLYYVDSSPRADRRGIDYQRARRVWREGAVERFSRKYDVPAFLERVVSHMGPLRLTIRYVENETEVAPNCYLKLAAVFEQP